MMIDYLTAAGKQLEYTWAHRAPAGDEPVLVFLHEGLGCIAMWRDFPKVMSEALDMPGLVYSRAGYGGSDPISLPRPITSGQTPRLDPTPPVCGYTTQA